MEVLSKKARFLNAFEIYGILAVIVVICLISAYLQPDAFPSWRNITNIFKQIAPNAMLAIGMFLVILTAGIDLSVGSVLALSMMSLAVTAVAGVFWPISIFLALAVGLTCGVFNGIGIVKFKMPHPFIMTLGTLFIARGLANLISGGIPHSGLPYPIRFIGIEKIDLTFIFGERVFLPVLVILILLVYGLFWFVLEKTVFGRRIYAIGGNPNAARVSGVNTDQILVYVYAICGLMAAIAAIIMAGRTNSGFPNAGDGMELEAIAAVIIGGASFFGGRGHVFGVFGGVIIMGLIRNMLNLNNVSAFWQQCFIGAIIIAAVLIDVLRREVSHRN